MKGKGLLVAALLAVVGFLGLSFATRNAIIARDEAATRAWANVESAYQRRLDLIPNLVETVKGAAKYEGETMLKVTEARNQVLALAKQMGSALAERDPAKLDQLEGPLMGAVRAYTGLAAEAYPTLKATDAFVSLQAELAGTENRVNVARRDYNQAVAELNTTVRQWGWLPFCGGVAKLREPFRSAPAAYEPPKVKFE
jgi:LemA protein